eukprot:COSAG06_NODE_18895_length_863_cov_0.819372_1_plen_86_part_10
MAQGCTGDAMSAGMETPKPKPVEMTEKSTPELFNAQSELDRAMKVAMNDKITGASAPSIHDAPSPPARRSPHAYPAPHAPRLVYQD